MEWVNIVQILSWNVAGGRAEKQKWTW